LIETFLNIKEIYVNSFSTIHFITGRSIDLNLSYAIKQLAQTFGGSFLYIQQPIYNNNDFLGSLRSFDLFTTTLLLGVNLRYDNPLYAVTLKQNKSSILSPVSLSSFLKGKDPIWKVLTSSLMSSLLVIHATCVVFSFVSLCQLKVKGVFQKIPLIMSGDVPIHFEGMLLNNFNFKQNAIYFTLESENTFFNEPTVISLGSHNTERLTDLQIPCAHVFERKNAILLGQEGSTFKNTFLFLPPAHTRDPITTLRLITSFLLKRVVKIKDSKLWRNNTDVFFCINTKIHYNNKCVKIPFYKYRTLQERSSLYLTMQFKSFKLF